jgi:hypothetical protein
MSVHNALNSFRQARSSTAIDKLYLRETDFICARFSICKTARRKRFNACYRHRTVWMHALKKAGVVCTTLDRVARESAGETG